MGNEWPGGTFSEFLRTGMAKLDASNQRRKLCSISGGQGPRIVLEGRSVLNFCSNNYLGLADDDRLITAAMESLRAEGLGAGASRLVCGNMSAHARLEQALADFKDTQASLVFSSGYMANVGIISSLFGRDDVIFSDRLNHASIIDGIHLSGAKMVRYPHGDPGALDELIRKNRTGYRKRVIVTDSVFSMDGDLAPLEPLIALARHHDCFFMIDEAHALGVFGARGRGLAEHCGVEKKVDIQMGTLSKAAGAFGAYVCGSRDLIDFLMNRARSFIYTTAMPPAVAAAGCRALEIIVGEPRRREQLWANVSYLREQCLAMGWDIGRSQSPIFPLMLGDSDLALNVSRKLLEKGVFVSAIRPPTVPPRTARLRLTVMATHTREDLDTALQALRDVGGELCLL